MSGSIHVTKWTQMGEPAGVPFRFVREFHPEELDRWPAGQVEDHIRSFMLASAKLYAQGAGFRFLPVHDKDIKAFLPHSIVIQSEAGEILLDSVFDRHGKGKLWAGVIMEVDG